MQREDKSMKERFSRQAKTGKSAELLEKLEKEYSEKRELSDRSGEAPEAEKKLAELRARNAEKRLELFFREHDSAGSWKSERFNRDMARDLRDRRIERNEQGKIERATEDEKSHVLMVNMGELDRLNAIGGHELGDQGLRKTLEFVESVIRENLGSLDSSSYEIYRYSGNDFTVTLNGVDEDTAREIGTRISRESVDLSSIRPNLEAVPLTASRVSRANAVSLVNRLESKPEEAGLTEEGLLIDATREKLQTMNDAAKLERRTSRIVEMIRLAEDDPEAAKRAREFYETFLKKSLGSVFRVDPSAESAGYDAFRDLLAEKRALDVPPPEEWTHFLAERALDGAFESLKARRAVGRKIELDLARMVASESLNRLESFGRTIDTDIEPATLKGFEPPKETQGKRTINALREKAAKAEAASKEGSLAEEDAEGALLDYQLELAKRNEHTGLNGRGVYFETMKEGFESGRSVATIAIDMAFLKYFDKEGGPQTGNTAILKAAEILDRIASEKSKEGIEVVAYRTGGDEFAITVVGGDEKIVGEIVASVRETARNSGRVPPSEGASASYGPEDLQFNYGIRRAESASSFRNELAAAGIKTPEIFNAETAADYMARLADKEIEIQKGVNRIMLLITRKLAEEQTGEMKNFDQLAAYSTKAVFGKSGMDKIAEVVDRLKDRKDAQDEMGKVKGEALEFVLREIDKKNAEQIRLGAELGLRVEDAVKFRYLENRVADLEEEIVVLRMRLDKEKTERESLRAALKAAEDERDSVIRLRERIQGAQIMRAAE